MPMSKCSLTYCCNEAIFAVLTLGVHVSVVHFRYSLKLPFSVLLENSKYELLQSFIQ